MTAYRLSESLAVVGAQIEVVEGEYPQLPTCETCGGAGFVVSPLRKREDGTFGQDMFECPDPDCPVVRQQQAARWTKLCTQAQIPPEYGDLSFQSWETLFDEQPDSYAGKQDALGAALAFVDARNDGCRFTLAEAAERVGLPAQALEDSRRGGLVLSGANGVGKTSLAVSIARDLLNYGVAVLYIRLGEFFDGLKERFKDKSDYDFLPDAEDESALMTMAQRVPVLIIDEFYADATAWRKERAGQLVNYRYTHQMPTVITTNLSRDALVALWGATTGHRIQAMSHWITMTGLELRKRGGEVHSR